MLRFPRPRRIAASRSLGHWGSALLPALLLHACGHALQAGRIDHTFEGQFGCSTASLYSIAGGWHVEGCGRIAEYTCLRDGRSASAYASRDAAASALGDVMFAGFDERCLVTHSELTPWIIPEPSDMDGHVARLMQGVGGPARETRVAFEGGFVRVVARPSLHLDRVLLWVHSDKPWADLSCGAELIHDGVPLAVVQQARSSEHDMQLVVTLDALYRATHTGSLAGSLCGAPIALSTEGRAQLADFAVEVHGLADHIQHPPKTMTIAEGREAYADKPRKR